jgi:ATP-binding cassette subfamily F protein uup
MPKGKKMVAEAPIYTVRDARLSFGLKPLFLGVDLYINRGDKICLVGRNGCGKSTLLKVIAGEIEADDGEFFIQPGMRVGYMPQEPDLSGYKTLRQVVESGLPVTEKNQTYRADKLIEYFDIRAEQHPAESSGGECRKAALAKALILSIIFFKILELQSYFLTKMVVGWPSIISIVCLAGSLIVSTKFNWVQSTSLQM